MKNIFRRTHITKICSRHYVLSYVYLVKLYASISNISQILCNYDPENDNNVREEHNQIDNPYMITRRDVHDNTLKTFLLYEHQFRTTVGLKVDMMMFVPDLFYQKCSKMV
jgi:hypothetical protein